MQLLFLFFIMSLSLATNTLDFLEHADSCRRSENITVPYTLWIGTDVQEVYTIDVPAKLYTTFYDVMLSAEKLSWDQYNFETICSAYGHYITSIGGHKENSTANDYWLIFNLSGRPVVTDPPSSSQLSPAGVDGLRVVENKYYLFWLRNPDFLGQ